MSPKYSRLTAGLTALGLLGFVAPRAASAAEPPMPTVTPAATAPSNAERVLLKTDGRVLRGVIVEEDGQFVVRQRAGEIRIKKFDAEHVFGSIEDVYRYKRSLVPEADPDEHLKLAKWCLAQHLRNEAKTEVETVLKLTPKAREAVAMLASIEASEARDAKEPRVDRDVVRTGGTMPEPRASHRQRRGRRALGNRRLGLATSASRTRSRRCSRDLRSPSRRGRETSRPVRARRSSGSASGLRGVTMNNSKDRFNWFAFDPRRN